MKNFKLFLVALVGIALSSCSPETNVESTLQGLWKLDNSREYVRFTSEESDEYPYLLGCEWNLDEDVTEQDRKEQRTRDGFPGNGWFKYKMEVVEKQGLGSKEENKLTEIHFMDNGGAEIPKIYIVTTLTSSRLIYHEKDNENIKFSYTRQ